VERDTGYAQTLRANTAALRVHAEDHLWMPDGHVLLFRAGRSLDEAGLVKAAIAHFERLVTEATTRLGPDHPDTLTTRGNLAYWREEAGDPAGAAAAFETLLGDSWPDDLVD
jgi:Tetratricopeptide repeat